MFTHTLNPILFHLGPLQIRWYGLMYVIAFIITFYYVRSAIRKGKLSMNEKQLDNFMGLLVVAMILGARIFEILFYEPAYYFSNPLKMLAIWEGGLSFHGALLSMVLLSIWYLNKHKISFWKTTDTFIVPIVLGNALGRIGNFINGELYGKVTELPWGVVFSGVSGARHPTQLYEAAYNIVIFGILFSLRNKNWKDGTLFGLFLVLYSIARFLVEFLKDMPITFGLTTGQWLCIPMLLAGVCIIRRNF